jgi:hypothetical protein
MWFALLLTICIRHQAAATRQREVLEVLRARRMMPAPVGVRNVSPVQPGASSAPTS